MTIIKQLYFLARALPLLFLRAKKTKGAINPAQIDSICVIRIDRIGDVVVSLPALYELKKVFPRSRITVVARPQLCGLLALVPGITPIPYKGFWSAIAQLRNAKFSMVIDFLRDYTLKTALLAYLSRAKVTVGLNSGFRGLLFTVSVELGKEKKPMRTHILDLVRVLAARAGYTQQIPEELARLTIPEDDKAFALAFLDRVCPKDLRGLPGTQVVVGIHPGGYFPSQKWMAESFVELARRISGKYNARIIVFGSVEEQRSVEKMVLAIGAPATAALGMSLNHLAALISLLDILICNNSGLLHLAAAVGIPTVSTMGPTDPVLWYPAADNAVVIRKDLACSPCGKPRCFGHRCMKDISVDEMEKAVGERLKVK